MKTRYEVEKLKTAWVKDPCWDIEATEGFEDYKDELAFFHIRQQVAWNLKKEKHETELRSKICPIKMLKIKGSWNCEVGLCAWWNEAEEKCAIRVLNMRG